MRLHWGNIDAYREDDFFSKCTLTPSFKRCIDSNVVIVTGEKGSGKSALARALYDVRKDYDLVSLINFDDVGFNAVYSRIQKLCRAVKLPKLNVLSHLWFYLFFEAILERCLQSYPGDAILQNAKKALMDLPQSTNGKEAVQSGALTGVFYSMLSAITELTIKFETILNDATIGEAERERQKIRHIANVHNLSSLPGFRLAVVGLRNFLERRKIRVLTVCDGFDKLRNEARSHPGIQLAFESLITSAYSDCGDTELANYWSLKILIPFDRYLSAIPKLRDGEKFTQIHAAIKWDLGSLKDLVKKRAAVALGTRVRPFSTVWAEVMPLTIANGTYNGIAEDSFEYIARHTMFRPRQMLQILERIHSDDEIAALPSEEVVRTAVRSVCEEVFVSAFKSEFGSDFKSLDVLLTKFKNRSNIMSKGDFRELVASVYTKYLNKTDTDEAMRRLFATGFFGIIRQPRVHELDPGVNIVYSHAGRQYICDFFYKSRSFAGYDVTEYDDDVCIHPMFQHALFLNSDKHRIVG